MGGSERFRPLTGALVAMAAGWLGMPAPADAAQAWQARVSGKLLALHASPSQAALLGARVDASGRIQVDVHYDCGLDAPAAALSAAGLAAGTAVKVPPLCVIEGWVAADALPQVAAVEGVEQVGLPVYALQPPPRPRIQAQAATTNCSSSGCPVDGNGVSIMHAAQFVSQTGTSGTGIKVGVQSTGVSSLTLIESRGELPATVQVVTPAGGGSTAEADEGTALLEEVHAVAPGAGLAFCGPATFVDYVSCLGQLIDAGATVLADDIAFPSDDLMTSDNSNTAAVQQVLSQNPGVMLFTSVGNYNGSYWQGTYAPIAKPAGVPALTCAASGSATPDSYVASFGTASSLELTVDTGGATFPLVFAWADPLGQNSTHLDVYVFEVSTASPPVYTQMACLSTSSTAAGTGNLLSQTLPLAAGTYLVYVASPDTSAQGKFLKLWAGGDGLTTVSPSTAGSVISPQAFAAGAISIGAVNGSDGTGDSLETYSSLGPVTFVFPVSLQLQAPFLTAPDGIYVDAAGTYFEADLFPDGNFYGTSASVPNAAGIAALLRGAFPALPVAQVAQYLENGATALGSTVPDDSFGYGRVDALGALGQVPAPTITSLPNSAVTGSAGTPAYSFTVTGTGSLHFSVSSTNAALIPATLVAAGSAGVTLSPSTCGVSTFTCTVALTPALGQAGTADVTLSVLDGANRSASSAMTLTSTDPAPAATSSAPASTAAGGGSGGGGGGALKWWEIALLALLLAARPRCGRAPELRRAQQHHPRRR